MEIVRKPKSPLGDSRLVMPNTLRLLLIASQHTLGASISNLLSEILDSDFYLDQVATVESGFTRLSENTYDIYFIDSEVERGSGFDLLVRGINAGCRRPVVFLSAKASSDENREVLRAGALDYLPRDTHDLAEFGRVLRLAIERLNAHLHLEYHLHFEKLLTSIATDFINLPTSQIDSGIQQSLQQIASFAGAERSYVIQYSEDKKALSMTHEWHAPSVDPASWAYREVPLTLFSPIIKRIQPGKALLFRSLNDLPRDAGELKELLRFRRVKSIIFVPLHNLDEPLGLLGFSALRRERNWSPEVVALLNFMGQIIVNALMRKRNDHALRTQDSLLRQIIDITPNLLHVRDREGRYVLVNPAFAASLGKDSREIIGRRDVELGISVEESERRKGADEDALSRGTMTYAPEEPSLNLSTQSVHWYRTIRYPLPSGDGMQPQVLTISTDLTERRRAEDALRKLLEGTASATGEDFFRSLVLHVARVLDTRYAFVGRVASDAPDIVETLAVWRDGEFIPNEKYKLSDSPTAHILTHGLQVYQDNIQEHFPSDHYLHDEGIRSYMGAPLITSDDKSVGILSVMDNKPMNDWPPAKWIMRIFAARAAAELERLQMERERSDLHKQLMQAQKMEAIGQLAAGVAHDLNNSLGAVVGHLQLLNIAARLEPEWRNSVNIALKGCERASSLIEQLVGFSRQGRYNPQQLSPRKLVSETLDFLSRVLAKDIRIEFGGSAGNERIVADPAQIQQALTNIIINAAQSMPNGGTLSISFGSLAHPDPARFNRKAAPGRYVFVTIGDTGVGIPEHNLEKIFEPFFTTKEHGKGSGLGLPMVYGIMQSHGGWIEVRSRIGHGSSFTLYFPELMTPIEEHVEEQREAKRKVHGTVMVIDDEQMLVDLTIKFLERTGLTAVGFSSTTDALAWFGEHAAEVDLVVLDMRMPEMSGQQCFEALRKINPKIEVIILSGYTQDVHAQKLQESGVLRFFQKPLKYPELMDWISNHMKNR